VPSVLGWPLERYILLAPGIAGSAGAEKNDEDDRDDDGKAIEEEEGEKQARDSHVFRDMFLRCPATLTFDSCPRNAAGLSVGLS